MKHNRDDSLDALVSEAAAAWFIRLMANDLSVRERREYLAWLKQSSRHVEALLDIYRYHGYGRKAKLHNAVPADAAESESGANVIPFIPRRATPAVVHELHELHEHHNEQSEQGWRPSAVSVAAVLAGVAFSLFAIGVIVKVSYFDRRLATGPSEWQETVLADNSVLHVGPNTVVRWSFTDKQRSLVLSQGEALFEVAKDARRPFIVATEVGEVRAVGTEFGVSLMNASTAVVTVAHGEVAVSQRSSGHFIVAGATGAVSNLVADQQLVISADRVAPVKQVDASRELQWANGYFEFRGETVQQAVNEFNRRNRIQVVLADPAIGDIAMPFTTVRLDDPETFAAMVAARPDVQVAYQDAKVIRLLPE